MIERHGGILDRFDSVCFVVHIFSYGTLLMGIDFLNARRICWHRYII
ncbi:MAG: phosphatidate cytidylyltransferase [Campylobacteraceae bacterium]|nr:phosphatidate cytidylyltransferase [Campylobacteraceae bacterium]